MKRNAIFLAVASLFAEAAFSQTPPVIPVNTLPTGGVVRKGDATINAPVGSKLTVDQTSRRALIDWGSFDIGKDAWVHINQTMGSSAITANRVPAATTKTTIEGMLTAPGHVLVLNTRGVLFTGSAVVNVGSLTASSGQISESHFEGAATMPITITGATTGRVENQGTITVADSGLVAFVAPSVVNSGVITATKGRIVLASAEEATLSLNGNDLYELAVTKGIADGSIDNTGTLKATGVGGTVILSALDAANAVSGLINLDGVQQATRIEVHGGVVELKSDLNASTVAGGSSVVNVSKTTAGGGEIQDGVNIARSGGSVNVGAGTFAQSATLKVDKSLTLAGAGESLTTIDARTVSGYGMLVTADNTSLSGFTLYGPTADAGSSYGIKVQPAGSAASSRLLDFSISNVTSRGAGRAELDLNGVNGATIDHVTANGAPVGNDAGTTKGAGIQVTDSANVTIKNSLTRNNAWGGVALYQANRFYDQQTSNITVQNNNTFTEANPLYLQDESASRDFGSLSLQGFSYAVRNPTTVGSGSSEVIQAQYTWMQKTAQGAYNLAVNLGSPDTSYAQGWSGTALTQAFYVGVGNLSGGGTRAMKIMQAVNSAAAGAAVHVGAGTFAEQLAITQSLSLLGAGADQTTISPASLAADASGMRNILTISGAATNAEVSGFKFKGPVPEITAGIFVRDGAHAHIHHNKLVDMRESAALSGNQRGVGIFVGRALLATSGTAVIEGNVITGYQKGGIVVDGPGSQATITGNTITGEGPTTAIAQNGIQVSRGANATVDGNTVSGNAYTGPRGDADDFASGILFFISNPYLGQGGITIGSGNTITANEFGIWTNDQRTLTTTSLAGVGGNTRNAVAYFTGGYAGQGPLLEYPAWSASNAALVSAGTFGGKLSGDIVDSGGALRVTGWSGFAAIQPAVDAVAAGGSVNVASGTYAESVVLDGLRNLAFSDVTLGGLTINSGAAGSGVGGNVTANGPSGFLFNAPVVLLGDTALSTTGANITLNGDIQGFGGNPYALSLDAGTGNVTLVSGGSAGNPLGSLFVASNDFTLLGTLWVSGYDIDALGTVTLSAHTLRSIGGSAGTIDAEGYVTGGVFSDGPVFVQSASGVDITGSAPTLVIDAPSGSVSGDFGQVTNTGSGLIEVNGQPLLNATLAASADNNRVVPAEVTTAASPEAGGTRRDGKVRKRRLEDAVEVLDNGEALEIDLSPGND